MDLEQIYQEVNSQLDKDTFDNRIILTLSEWNCIRENLVVSQKIKEMTLRQLMANITNDCQEDADTGFSWELTIKQYIKNLFNIF
jgi:hypothetical protein